jgi:hypothetical protein
MTIATAPQVARAALYDNFHFVFSVVFIFSLVSKTIFMSVVS